MTGQVSNLLRQALELSDTERADLAGALIESIDQGEDAGAEAAWDTEIAKRVAELERGDVQTVPWEEVRTRIDAKLRARR